VIASLSWRQATSRARSSPRARTSTRSMATGRAPARPARPATHRRASGAVRVRARARAQANITWETRTFGVAAGAIAAGFLLAVLYLGQITGVSAHDYETQRLEARRDELRRQAALLDVQLAKLDAPARIEAQALRLGLVRVGHVPVLSATEVAARR
jgi:hypothetical protein